jgi:hypothetical protein
MKSFFEMVADVSLIFQNAGYIQAFRIMFEVENIILVVYGLLLISVEILIWFCKN